MCETKQRTRIIAFYCMRASRVRATRQDEKSEHFRIRCRRGGNKAAIRCQRLGSIQTASRVPIIYVSNVCTARGDAECGAEMLEFGAGVRGRQDKRLTGFKRYVMWHRLTPIQQRKLAATRINCALTPAPYPAPPQIAPQAGAPSRRACASFSSSYGALRHIIVVAWRRRRLRLSGCLCAACVRLVMSSRCRERARISLAHYIILCEPIR